MDAATGASDADELAADELAEVVGAIDELLALSDLGREAIDLEDLTHKTGIPAGRVIELLDGARPATSPERLLSEQQVFVQRLRFLRETRRAAGGKVFTLDEIAAGVGISHGAVGYMINGDRTPRIIVAKNLERFFGVTPGFFTASEHQLLLGALRPVRDELHYLALLKGKGITQIALRSTAAADDNSTIAKELRSALATALTQQTGVDEGQDPEVRELSKQLTSLPPTSRHRVMPVIRSLLGLVPPDDDGSESSAQRTRTAR
ncbi:helix-turn-helix transcriptional regulator [Streptomyces sp. NPDC001787]|uniref:helix-turn-helix domain-containing protein n=1 Tax=Streptomyces sp. NPDC001787 TaxID=3154523 RepID=UPI00331D851E